MKGILDHDLLLSKDGRPYLTRWNLGYKLRLALSRHFPTFTPRWLLDRFPAAWNHTSTSALLHHIEGPDADRHLHNHPWFAVAIILRGGYYQEVVDTTNNVVDYTPPAQFRMFVGPTKMERVRWINVLRVDQYHRIIAVDPNTWTITFTGKLLKRGWGFLVGHSHMDHKSYLKGFNITSEDDQ